MEKLTHLKQQNKYTPIKKSLLFFLLLVTTATLWAQKNYDFSALAPSGQTLYYKINTDGISVSIVPEKSTTPYYTTKPTGALTIPSSVTNGSNTYAVTSIGNSAFYTCGGITSVSIPNSVTSIGEFAFFNCNGLTSVSIPNTITSIGKQAFCTCLGLTEINVVSDNPNYTSIDGILYNKSKNTLICCPAKKTGSITIPNSVTNIDNYAFYSCSGLTGTLTIPNSVTSIGKYAFFNCPGFTGTLTIPNSVTNIGEQAFRSCSNFTSVTIPNSITSIEDYVFYLCSGLTGALTIPNSVTNIGNHAFYKCSNLTSVTIPNSVTHIRMDAFEFCSGLTCITIPNSVTSIAFGAFQSCSGLAAVYCEALTPPNGSGYTNQFSNYNIPLYVPSSSIDAYRSHAVWGQFTTILPISNTPYTVSASVNDASMGTVTGGGNCNYCETITLTATPNAGYCFIKWQDDNTDNPRTVTITQDSSFTATFDCKRRNHTATVCQGEAYAYQDSVFNTTTAGTFSKEVRFSNAYDCDSVVTVNLTVTAKSSATGIMLKDTCFEMGKATQLKVESPVATATYRFYDSHHALLHTGTEYTTTPLSSEEVFYVTMQEPSKCESAEKSITISECVSPSLLFQLHKTVDNASVCKNGTITITTVIEKLTPALIHKIQIIEDFGFADLELLTAELKIDGKAIPYTRDVAHDKLFFNMGELSGIGTYTLTITARAFPTLGPKTETTTIRWANYPTGITETVPFNVVD